MFHTRFFTLIALGLVSVLAVQVPLGPTQHQQHDPHEWIIDKFPNPNATDHLVFETVHSLLQIWPNVRMRNGHNIVPGIIPRGTLLYHGRTTQEVPQVPEWTATDPEHSYFFCRDLFDTSHEAECWLLTLMTTRPLEVVYFDGSSSAKLPYGSFDTQELIIWGEPSDGDLFEEEGRRIQDLCRWGKKFGVDGFVRMQSDFEVMLCDFTSGVDVTSFANLVSGWKSNRSIMPQFNQFELVQTGSRHYHFPGETRIQLDLAGLVSFYDTQLAPSLVPIRVDQERWDHRAANVSSEDLAAIKSRLEANLIMPDGASSGIDWKTLIQVVIDRFAQRLELMQYLVNSSATGSVDILNLAKKAQTQLRIMLTPYILSSAVPTSASEKADALGWAMPIYKLCATTHTHSMEFRFESMTDSEQLLLRAIRGTSKEICRTVTKMWTAGVHAGIDPLLDTQESPDINEVTRLMEVWARELGRLMGWLDWHVWVKCEPGCGPEEMCYLPAWPVGFPWLAKFPDPSPIPRDDDDELFPGKVSSIELWARATRRLGDEMSSAIKPGPDEWIRPQPKCIRRIAPYTF